MTLGVTPSASVTTSFQVAYNAVFPTQSAATNIGTLVGNSTELNVLGQTSQNVSKNIYSFDFQSGDTIKAGFNNLTGSSALRFQLYDSAGNLIADSNGTADQQAAFAQLNSSTGLAASNGQYYAQVSYAPSAQTSSPLAPQDYNFQLYSGTTYNNAIVTSAQTQAYDPNLFVAPSDSVIPASNVQSYVQTATFAANPSASNAVSLGNLISDQTTLTGSSTLPNGTAAEYYSFNFQQGSAIKLGLDNTTANGLGGTLRAQLFDSSGAIVADNLGTQDQQQAFLKLNSGEGLAAANGQYTVKISAADAQAQATPQSYNLQLYSGENYSTSYQTTASLSTVSQGATDGVNLNVFASSDATLGTQSAFNTIDEAASSGVNIGWLQENKTNLAVESQLTTADSADFYSFTLQPSSSYQNGSTSDQASPVKFDFTNSTNTSPLRVQLLDSTGLDVIADNYGTDQQKQAYTALTSSNALNLNPATYTVKVSYAPGADQTAAQTYNFDLYAGTSYTEKDQTTASAQTIANSILSGGTGSSGSYSAATAAASYLNDLSNGSTSDVISALSSIS